jgi:hypothetical protein
MHIVILDIKILLRSKAVLKKLLPAAPFFFLRDIDELYVCLLHFRFIDVQPGSFCFSSMGDKIQKKYYKAEEFFKMEKGSQRSEIRGLPREMRSIFQRGEISSLPTA